MANIKELSKQPERLSGGHRLCAGCGASIVVRQVLMGTKDPVIAAASTGCLEVATTIYPYTAWKVPFIHNAFENVAATISGIETAYKALKKKGKIKKEIKFVAFGGDGGTYDIGLQALSGALERGHNFVYVCLPPDTEIILEDGSVVEIGQLVDEAISQHSRKGQVTVKRLTSQLYSLSNETEKVEISPITKSLLSWNGREFVPMKAVRVQRKNSPNYLIKIITSSGLTLRLTEEHPVLVDGVEGPEWKEAGLLKVRDEVYSARKINILNNEKFNLVDLISMDRNINISLPVWIKDCINKKIINKFGTIKKAAESIGFKYWQFKERDRKVNLYEVKKIYQYFPELNWELLTDNVNEFVVRGGNVIKVFQKRLTEDILYILGFISSEGYIGKQKYHITLTNKDTALIKTVEDTYYRIFKGRKVSKVQDEKGIWYLTISDPILYNLAKRFDVKDNPKELIKLPEPLIAAFLKGCFDGDGHCSNNPRRPIIIISTIKKLLADRLRLLLQRLGIAGFQDSRENRFDIIVSSNKDMNKFIELVGSNSSIKKRAMDKVKNLLKNRKERGKYFSLAPRVCGKLIRELCKKNNITITDIDKKRNICTLAVAKRRATKRKIKEYLDKMGRAVLRDPLIYKITNLLLDDFYLDPIRKIERVKADSKYVYDFTVEPSHVFVPGGKFVISNCYNNEAYQNTGAQRSGATPKGASTTTAPSGKASFGKPQLRKDLTSIVAAHRIPYVAQASASHWNDLVTKSEKAFKADGPAFLNVISMCHRGWRFPQEKTIEISKLAVETGFWPLIEIENGQWKFTYKPKQRKPVIEFLKLQGRFKHLFKEENKHILEEIQKDIDENWTRLERMCEASCKIA